MRFLGFLTALLSASALVSAASFSNPLRNPEGSDPFIVWTGGYYYFLTTTWTNVQISRATSLNGLKTAEKKVVYQTTSSNRCCNVWAPEVHYLNGKWYIYYTAGQKENLDAQSIHVLEGGATPWDSYKYVRKMSTGWSIDASVLRFNDWGNYLIYSCFLNGSPQSLCIASLTNPTTMGTPKLLSVPTASWEIQGVPVNEGPAAFYKNGKTYVAFSGSYCWTNSYALGYLTWNGSGDPSLSSSWSKTGPVFSSANGNYGTAHNGFFTSPDGTELWNVYHATSISGGACDGNRYTMAQKVNWNSNGTPNFGAPVAKGVTLAGPSGE